MVVTLRGWFKDVWFMENICVTRKGVDMTEIGWFKDGLRRRVGSGENSPSYNDGWLRCGPLRYKLSRLFYFMLIVI